VELLNTDPGLSLHSRKVLERIERAADNMSQIVETLLVLAREDKVSEEEISNISDVAQGVVEDNQHLLRDKPVTLATDIKRDFGLQVPRSILTILLGNLLRNAIAYTNEGDVAITVESPRVLITDTGKGIASEELPRIFDRHYRGDNNSEKGSGIGLAIVRRICDRYGWQVDVTSASGSGTVVSIDFNRSL
jgi:signal transduction histidine kinase